MVFVWERRSSSSLGISVILILASWKEFGSYFSFFYPLEQCLKCLFSLSFSCIVMSDSIATPWTATRQAPLSFTISWSLPKFISIASVMPSSHLILCHPLLLPSVFPSIRDFSNESAVCIRWPKYWSFSISPSNEYSGSLRLTGLISLPSRGISGVFSSTTVQKHQFFGTLPSLWSSSHNCTWPLGRP